MDDDDDTSSSYFKLFTILGGFNDPRVGGGDSGIDRLNCKYTTMIFFSFAGFVTARMYFVESITCWLPKHLTKSQRRFTNDACWVSNTYRLPFESRMPRPDDVRDYVCYYQWVGLVLCAQGLCFYLPRPVWSMLAKRSGITVSTITDAAIECQRKRDAASRDRVLQYMINHMGRFLKEGVTSSMYVHWYGSYLVLWYLFIKIIYVGNVILQLVFVTYFIGSSFHLFGFGVIERLIEGKSFFGFSERFPRVTYCDFQVRVLGNVQNYTVQCTLHVNLFNEAIYVFIWFWLVIVGTATTVSLVLWSVSLMSAKAELGFVATRLIAMQRYSKAGKDAARILREFVRKFLRRDGVFVLRLVQLLCGLWDHYLESTHTWEKLNSKEKTMILDHDVDLDDDG